MTTHLSHRSASSLASLPTVHVHRTRVAQRYCVPYWENRALIRYTKRWTSSSSLQWSCGRPDLTSGPHSLVVRSGRACTNTKFLLKQYKLVKPYRCFQTQGHVSMFIYCMLSRRYNLTLNCFLLACRCECDFASTSKSSKREWAYYINIHYKSTVMPNLNTIYI